MSVQTASSRRMIFHADDFGMNGAINQGILVAFRNGLLTSTSLLSNAPTADAACQSWTTLIAEQVSKSLPSCEARRDLDDPSLPFDLGIHLNLTQGRPLTSDRYPSYLLDENGNFPGIGRLYFRLSRASSTILSSVATELQAQIEWMCDRGMRPTHLNGHQYIELIPQIAAMIPEMMRRYSISVVRAAYESGLARTVLCQGRIAAWGLGLIKRHYASAFRRQMRNANVAFPDRFFGTSHAGLIDQQTLQRFLRQPLEAGSTEIGLHPGVQNSMTEDDFNDPWFDPLARLRPAECEWLCSTELAEFLKARELSLGRLQVV